MTAVFAIFSTQSVEAVVLLSISNTTTGSVTTVAVEQTGERTMNALG
ncbi:MAG: hypothetical protein WCI94_03325 [Rhodospirillales bacterium]